MTHFFSLAPAPIVFRVYTYITHRWGWHRVSWIAGSAPAPAAVASASCCQSRCCAWVSWRIASASSRGCSSPSPGARRDCCRSAWCSGSRCCAVICPRGCGPGRARASAVARCRPRPSFAGHLLYVHEQTYIYACVRACDKLVTLIMLMQQRWWRGTRYRARVT